MFQDEKALIRLWQEKRGEVGRGGTALGEREGLNGTGGRFTPPCIYRSELRHHRRFLQ
jgi:hypothetical protein